MSESNQVRLMSQKPWILGLDLGVGSVGWVAMDAGIELDTCGRPRAYPNGLRDMGVRIFPSGREPGKGEELGVSKAVARRLARQLRRQTRRRRERLAGLYGLLAGKGLLPALPVPDEEMRRRDQDHYLSAERDKALAALDKAILDRLSALPAFASSLECYRLEQLLPYVLRELALQGALLTPFEVGRAIYHLSRRRGFKSGKKERRTLALEGGGAEKQSRKAKGTREDQEAPASAETSSEAQSGILSEMATLAQEIVSSGHGTLGAFLSHEDPHIKRIRQRHKLRQTVQDEFEAIWEIQQTHMGLLQNEPLREEVRKSIFFQRPLKSAAHLIGGCSLEMGQRRVPIAALAYQRFRMIQKVNDIQIAPDGVERALNDEERLRLLAALETQDRMTMTEVRKVLDLGRRVLVNLDFSESMSGEGGTGTALTGNRTAFAIRKVIGEAWDSLGDGLGCRDTVSLQKTVVDCLLANDDDKACENSLRAQLPGPVVRALGDDALEALSAVTLEDDYGSLSEAAIGKLLPEMEKGVRYASARKAVYGEPAKTVPVDLLPSVDPPGRGITKHDRWAGSDDTVRPWSGPLRNPTVVRTLSELRKVVNALIRLHGKPELIRVELARDAKRTKKERDKLTFSNLKRNKQKDLARAELGEHGRKVSGDDLEKLLLWNECNRMCPYTGNSISFDLLFSEAIEVEHIIPFARCLNNDLSNKTLSFRAPNQEKGNRTPLEAFGSDKTRWDAMVARVKDFKDELGLKRDKLRRFTADHVPQDFDGFSKSDLTNTQNATVRAVRYLALLYGGTTDDQGLLRIQVTKGSATAFLRRAWGMGSLLPVMREEVKEKGGRTRTKKKSRDDHRHHAIDALVIAMCGPKEVKELAELAKHMDRFRLEDLKLEEPIAGLKTSVTERLRSLVISRRSETRVRGGLHDGSRYGVRKISVMADGQTQLLRLAPGEDFSTLGKTGVAVIRKRVASLTVPNEVVSSGARDLLADAMIQAEKDHAFKKADKKRGELDLDGLEGEGVLEPQMPAEATEKASMATEPVDGKEEAPKKARPNWCGNDGVKATPTQDWARVKLLDGTIVPARVKRVLVQCKAIPKAVGGHLQRFVVTGGNHHMALRKVQAVSKAKGPIEKFKDEVVSTFDASKRLTQRAKIVDRMDAGGEFQYSLCIGDMIGRWDKAEGRWTDLWVVRQVSSGTFFLVRPRVATTLKPGKREEDAPLNASGWRRECAQFFEVGLDGAIQLGRQWNMKSPQHLSQYWKLKVGPLGDLHPAHD